MKKLITIFITFFSFFTCVIAQEKVTIHFFHSDSCPHCASEKEFLSTLDNVNVKYYEVGTYSNLLIKVNDKLNINSNSVPVTIIGSDYIVGYSDNVKNEILAMIESYDNKDYCDAVDLIIRNKDISECIEKNKSIYNSSEDKTINLLGKKIKFNAKEVSLPLISILIGFIDGFNPCAMWVLIFLLSMLFNMQNRKKMIILGLTFLITSALTYLFFMFGILKIASTFINFKYLIALVAIIGGLININGFIKSLKSNVGCQVTDKKRRNKIIEKIKSILSQRSFIISILGIILLAISVNFIELACSAGLPAMFIEILSLNDLNSFQEWLYLALYIIMFMIDDIFIFLIAVFTLKITGFSNKYTKYSHLIGGIIMLLVGILMIFKIDWLMFNF